MKMLIFCVRDRSADTYGNPMFLMSTGMAIRSFADEINRSAEDNMLYRHPEDFDLYQLGEYETDSGVFATHSPDQIAVGKDLVITKGK